MRLVFVPLLMFCNALPRNNIPVYIPSDTGFIVVMAAFALSNGYLSAVCFSQAPRYFLGHHQLNLKAVTFH